MQGRAGIYRDREQPGAETGTGGSTLWYQHRHEESLFNVPARRNFLKATRAELRHIVDEFIRGRWRSQASFRSAVTGSRCSTSKKGTMKQRIVQVLGNSYAAKLVSVQEQTDYMNIMGLSESRNRRRNPRRPVLLCQQPFYQKRLSPPCGDERLCRDDRQDSFRRIHCSSTWILRR